MTKMFAGLFAVCAIACAAGGQRYGFVAPTRHICTIGGFRQQLALAPDFRVDRPGDDDGFPSDGELRASFASDAAAVASHTTCPGVPEVGVFHMVLHHLEVGSSRSFGMKVASWTVFLIATLGLSSIYPLTEERWIMLELTADAMIGDHKVWSGQFTSFVKLPLMQQVPTAGTQLTALMLRAQDAAVKDLTGAMEAR